MQPGIRFFLVFLDGDSTGIGDAIDRVEGADHGGCIDHRLLPKPGGQRAPHVVELLGVAAENGIGELNQDIAMRNIRGRTALGYRVDAVAGLGLVTARTEQ